MKELKEKYDFILSIEVDDNDTTDSGKGYWVYLDDGYTTQDGTTFIHEEFLKDVKNELKYVIKGKGEL